MTEGGEAKLAKFFRFFKILSYVTLLKLAIEKVIFFFSISSHKVNNFEVLPLNEVEIWTILA